MVDDLNDVFFLDERRGWATGNNGTIVRTTDGGKTWTEENSRVKHRLERIYFRGGEGWIVGFGGTILSYKNTGNTSPDGKPSMQPKS